MLLKSPQVPLGGNRKLAVPEHADQEAIKNAEAELAALALHDVETDRGLLLAPETRTSSPLQVRRAADRSVEGFPRLYMVGEGAGWAGGIVSSAVDALRCVEAFGGR